LKEKMLDLANHPDHVLIALIFLLTGILFTAICLHFMKLAKDSWNWDTTEGEVTVSRVKITTSKNGKQYQAVISYKYKAHAEEYTSKRVYYGSNIQSSSRKRAEKLTEKYPVGAKVKVFYHPVKNSRAVIEPGAKWEIKFLLIFSTLFILVPLFLVRVSDMVQLIREWLN
jgi:hypothetical protein